MKRYDTPMLDLYAIDGADEMIRTSGMNMKATGSGGTWDVQSAIAQQQDNKQ